MLDEPMDDRMKREPLPEALETATPEAAAMSADRLEAAGDYVRKMVEMGALPLAQVLVARRSRIVLHRSFVNSEVQTQGHEITAESIFEIASVTKVLCALLVMRQVEMGNVSLEAPVAEYIPEFGGCGKGEVTPRHLLSHSSGMCDVITAPQPASFEDLLDRICRSPLVFEPGTRSSYCTLAFDLLAEILRRVTGRSLADLGDELLFRPMGMEHTHFRSSGEWRDRVVPIFDRSLTPHRDPFNAGLEPRPYFRFCSGGARGCSNLLDLAAVAQMMLNKGHHGGVRVLSPASVERMVERQFPWWDTPERLSSPGRYHFISKGLGWMVRGDAHFFGSDLMSPRAFFHGGAYGSRIVADPDYDLLIVFLTSVWHDTSPGPEVTMEKVPLTADHVTKIQQVFGNMVFAAIC